MVIPHSLRRRLTLTADTRTVNRPITMATRVIRPLSLTIHRLHLKPATTTTIQRQFTPITRIRNSMPLLLKSTRLLRKRLRPQHTPNIHSIRTSHSNPARITTRIIEVRNKYVNGAKIALYKKNLNFVIYSFLVPSFLFTTASRLTSQWKLSFL